jgi:uncharacterized protein
VLEKRINEALPEAMKDGDKIGVSVLRMVISEIKNHKIANLIKGDLPDDQTEKVLRKMAKKYKESIESFEKGGRIDLVAKENSELSFLSRFLPQELTEKEVEDIVDSAIRESGASSAKDLAAVMKKAMALAGGRADGKLVNLLVRKKLGMS